MIRISRHRIRSVLLGIGTVLTLLFTFLGILLILRSDPREASNAHLEKAQSLKEQAAQETAGQAVHNDLLQAAFQEYLQALKSDPYNPQIWQALPDHAGNLPRALLPRMMTLRRQILALDPPLPEKHSEDEG